MRNKTYPVYFTFPALALYLMLFIVPGVMGILLSFTDWSAYSQGLTNIKFVGFDNFATIFAGNQHFLKYIGNTVEFTVVTTLVKTALGLFFAVILNEGIKAKNFHRAMIFMPAILSTLVVGLIFKSILNPGTGLLNTVLNAVGLKFLVQQWLVDPKIAFASVMAVDTWKGVGYIMTIILAGLQSIPLSYYEAANIDGANFWNKFRYITMPLLIPALTVTTVLNLLYGLRVFDIVYVLTNGGPGYITEVMYTSVFKEFSLGAYGVGTAMSSVLFVFMVLVGYFTIKAMTRKEIDQ
jgi:raffinose/stachyose/melibiose transport system permease protein